MMNQWQGWLYVAAVLIPLGAFVVQLLFIRLLKEINAYVATAAILTSFALSAVGFVSYYVASNGMPAPDHGHHAEEGAGGIDLSSGGGGSAHSAKFLPIALRADEGLGLAVDHNLDEAGVAHHGEEPLAWTGKWTWVSLGAGLGGIAEPLVLPLEIHIDNLAAIMFLMVTLIASLIHIYSISYMSGDSRYPRFFAYLSLFCFSMLGLVASGNVFMIFVFWELVGVCSYLLIGFWYEEKKNADAANKAFITNRVGDVGMLIGLGLLWTQLGTFNISEINQALSNPELRNEIGRLTEATAGETVVLEVAGASATTAFSEAEDATRKTIPYWVLVVAGLGIFAGCVGKSAQFPLHVWLPDAMAGPTPVSALIHAATMVAAGVYLVGRFFPLFTAEVLLVIAYTGGITLFIAASIAMVQTDYKKVLAYSTVSQLGFMMLGLGVGGWAAGLFHLITHAFFKALLFLGAGSIYHSVHTYEMPVLGGLRKKMPKTAITMLIATMAISGVPFLSGFYSKDAILASAIFFVRQEPGHLLLLLLPTVGAAMTAFYMFRLWFLVFAGEPRPVPAIVAEPGGHAPPAEHGGHGHGHPVDHAHESPPLMTWPLILLAIPTVIIGWPITILPFFGYHPILEDMLAYGEPISAQDLGSSHLWALGASLLIAAIGIGGAVLYYFPMEKFRRFSPEAAAQRFGGVYAFLVNKWYFDEVYDALLVKPALALSRSFANFDRRVIDGIVDGSAVVTVGLSKVGGLFDKHAVDRVVNFVAQSVYFLGDWGRMIQTGRLRGYLMVLSLGVVLLSIGVFFWIR